ncbi:LysE/ArgO family amino acid transporter [Companilactobacillus sp. HBUAS59699]|uniref:LysE/ArgO family amino acid transporter n=1 Tax=Companilactobacillus sp. HBUAS59699 TaxID=3109358 RepID=UPI002FF1F562
MNYFFQGLTMGLAYVAPIGLQNLFVINSSLTHSKKRSLLNALIVIFFDISLALSCFFGIGAIMKKFQWLQLIILLVGSLIVVYIGANLLIEKSATKTDVKTTDTLRSTIVTAFVVTWVNPQAIIDGTMMLGAFHVTLPAASSSIFITGVALASAIWFTTLTLVISTFSNWFNPKILRIINLVCGIIIIIYGIKLFINFITLL